MTFDALLLLSFGGPEGPEQVMPFLENVTRGRGIPRERLESVAEHYLHFGGVSPINGINRELITSIEAELARRGQQIPVYFGNRNWEPYVEDTVATDARQRDSPRGGVLDVGLGRLLRLHPVPGGHRPRPGRGGSGRPGAGQAAAVLRPPAADRDVRRRHRRRGGDPARGSCAARRAWCSPRTRSRCARHRAAGQTFTQRQVEHTSALVAAAAGYPEYDQVWQSRSGPPQVPWLEPDVGDHLTSAGRTAAPRR